MSASLKRHARRVGMLLALLSCAYLGWMFWASLNRPGAVAPQWPGVWQGAGALAASVMAMAMVAIGWYLLVRGIAGPVSFSRTVGAYVLSQPAKYLPGNVLHFASRHWISRADGHQHGDLIAATVLESASLVALALALASISISGWLTEQHWSLPPWVLVVGAALLWATVLIWALLRRSRSRLQALVCAGGYLLCATGYFVFSAMALWILGGDALNAIAPSRVLAAIALSWVGGYLVLGAPGGIGVREALLVGLLGGGPADAGLLGAILTQRACMIVADFLLFAAGSLFKLPGQPVQRDSPT